MPSQLKVCPGGPVPSRLKISLEDPCPVDLSLPWKTNTQSTKVFLVHHSRTHVISCTNLVHPSRAPLLSCTTNLVHPTRASLVLVPHISCTTNLVHHQSRAPLLAYLSYSRALNVYFSCIQLVHHYSRASIIKPTRRPTQEGSRPSPWQAHNIPVATAHV